MSAGSKGMKILLAVLAIALILGMLVLIYFRVDGIKKAYENLAAEKAELSRDMETFAFLEALKNGEDELIRKYDRALKMAPEKPDEDEMIKYLQSKAEAAMLKFVRIEFGPREEESGYIAMPVELSFTGDYKDLLIFLELIAEGERAIRIDTLSVSSLDDVSGQITADISAHGFCRTDDAIQKKEK
jgi:Tfp pilus assembly protein PilO